MRKMIDAEISNHTQPIVEIGGAGSASAVRVGSAGKTLAEKGIADR